MAWFILSLGGLREVGWLIGLKDVNGPARILPWIVTVSFMIASLGLALRLSKPKTGFQTSGFKYRRTRHLAQGRHPGSLTKIISESPIAAEVSGSGGGAAAARPVRRRRQCFRAALRGAAMSARARNRILGRSATGSARASPRSTPRASAAIESHWRSFPWRGRFP